jgi:predicted ABC-type transport system involved in lysophospholipase L1 biosynthesis ATPase subunit
MSGSVAPLARCVDVGRVFGTGSAAVVALHDVTCEVGPEEHIAVTGPSGSGKSTLLHLMAGLDTPTSGSVDWPDLGGRDLLRPGGIGIVFQGPSLVAPLDVLENVALPLFIMGCGEAEANATAREALQLLSLEDLVRKLPEELSGGQAQRVAIARALAPRPRLLLADEPTGQLDRETGALVIDVLLHAALESNAALVVSTHDPVVSRRLAERWTVTDGRLANEEATCLR